MQEILLKVRYFERGLSKALKKVAFFFPNPVPFNSKNYQKQKGPGTSELLGIGTSGYSSYKKSSEKFLY